MANILGCLCACITAMTFVARSNKHHLQELDLIACITWGACAYVDYKNQAKFQPDAFKINMGLEGGLCLAFAYQYSTRGGGKGKQS